jgi:hypothetical protein
MSGFARSGHGLNCEIDANGHFGTPAVQQTLLLTAGGPDKHWAERRRESTCRAIVSSHMRL